MYHGEEHVATHATTIGAREKRSPSRVFVIDGIDDEDNHNEIFVVSQFHFLLFILHFWIHIFSNVFPTVCLCME